jgi:MFS family permease
VNVNAMVLFTRSSTDAIRGRVFSAIQGTVSAAQIAALAIGGLLLFEFAPRPIILVGAGASAVALAFTIGPVLRAGRSAEVTGDGVTADGAEADAVAA